MNTRHRKDPGDKLKDDIRKAVELGVDVQNAVRGITLKALSGGGLDTEAMRRVAHEVGSGVQLGLERHGEAGKAVLEKAYAGLDEAFAKAAEATTLALKEASGNARDFAKNDLPRMMDELGTLEQMYLDSLRETARHSKEVVSVAARRLSEHALHSGTAVGRQVQQSLAELAPLGHIAESQFRQGLDASLEAGALVARAASGFLAGIAERLEPHKTRAPGSEKDG